MHLLGVIFRRKMFSMEKQAGITQSVIQYYFLTALKADNQLNRDFINN
jgi:hypothetical protein